MAYLKTTQAEYNKDCFNKNTLKLIKFFDDELGYIFEEYYNDEVGEFVKGDITVKATDFYFLMSINNMPVIRIENFSTIKDILTNN